MNQSAYEFSRGPSSSTLDPNNVSGMINSNPRDSTELVRALTEALLRAQDISESAQYGGQAYAALVIPIAAGPAELHFMPKRIPSASAPASSGPAENSGSARSVQPRGSIQMELAAAANESHLLNTNRSINNRSINDVLAQNLSARYILSDFPDENQRNDDNMQTGARMANTQADSNAIDSDSGEEKEPEEGTEPGSYASVLRLAQSHAPKEGFVAAKSVGSPFAVSLEDFKRGVSVTHTPRRPRLGMDSPGTAGKPSKDSSPPKPAPPSTSKRPQGRPLLF